MDFQKKLNEIIFNFVIEYGIDKEEDISLFAKKLAREISEHDFCYDIYSIDNEIDEIFKNQSTAIFNEEKLKKIDTRIATYIATSNLLNSLYRSEQLPYNLMTLYQGDNMQHINDMKNEYISELINKKAQEINNKFTEDNHIEKTVKEKLSINALNTFMNENKHDLSEEQTACLNSIMTEKGYNAFISEVVNNISKKNSFENYWIEGSILDNIDEYLTSRGMKKITSLTTDEIDESLSESESFKMATRNCDEMKIIDIVYTSIKKLNSNTKQKVKKS